MSREFNIHYRTFIESLIYLLYIRVDLSFAVHELGNISSSPGKIHFEGLANSLRYSRDNNTLGLNYYAGIKDAPLSVMLRQASINIENQFMDFSDSIWQYFPDTGKSTGA